MTRIVERILIDEMAEVAGASDSDDRNDAKSASLTTSHQRFFMYEGDDPRFSPIPVIGDSISAEDLLYDLTSPLEEDVESEIFKQPGTVKQKSTAEMTNKTQKAEITRQRKRQQHRSGNGGWLFHCGPAQKKVVDTFSHRDGSKSDPTLTK